jgi:shikimate kinase
VIGVGFSNIALIGFMAAGKSSVGQALSFRTGLPFRDVDLLIEESEGMTIGEIFAARGESHFREVEGRIFRGLCAGEGQIIGCGGGTLLDPLNRAALRTRCVTVWLKASPGELVRRLDASGRDARPLLKGADAGLIVPSLLAAREGLYQGADLPIETEGRSIDLIAEEIAHLLALPSVRRDR